MKSALRKGFLLLLLLLAFTSCTSAKKDPGIRPIDPEHGGETKNLMPILKWSKAEDHNGTYDLIIYEFIKGDQFGKEKQMLNIYFRRSLPGGDNPQHQLELSLYPDKQFLWSVRPRNGQEVGEWAKMETNVFTGVSHRRRVRQFNFSTPEDNDGVVEDFTMELLFDDRDLISVKQDVD